MIDIKNIYKNFGGVQAVSNFSLHVGQGEVVALIGPNGAGKTTVFNIIAGFLLPDSGKIYFQGEDMIGFKPHEICHKGLARTFQIVRPFLYMSVLNNVIVGALSKVSKISEASKIAVDVLSLVGLYEKREFLAKTLTLPDRKRLELARVLATVPKILLLDEVMAGLTPKETDDLVNIIKMINKNGITIILIEHVMRAVMALSQRIVVINYGEKIAEGMPENVINDPDVIKAYFGEEFLHAQR